MSPMAPVDKSTKNSPSKDAVDKADKKARQSQEAPKSPGDSLITYFRGVRAEWGKISWPTWPQIWSQTIVVLVMTAILSLGLYLLDNTFQLLIDWMPGKKLNIENTSTIGR